MSRHGKIGLFGFAALLIFTLIAGIARTYHSREQDRFEAIVLPATASAAAEDGSPLAKMVKFEAKTTDDRTITVVSSRKQAPAPGDRIKVSTRVTLWGQKWYALIE